MNLKRPLRGLASVSRLDSRYWQQMAIAIPRMDLPAPQPWRWLAVASLLGVVLLNAWVCDDAYITFRTCFNLTHGHGPVYNVGERVQTFTNPLWMLLFSGVYTITGEAFFSSIGFAIVLLLGTAWLLQRRIFLGNRAGVAVVFLLGWSLAFVEYSTSGLENVLNGFLLAWFMAVFWNREDGRRKFLALCMIAALGMVSRMDTALIYLPAILGMAWRFRSWRVVAWLLLGCLPFIAWELFALVYYGFPFPNTAYAKLASGIPRPEYWQQGWWYFLNCLQRDPVTLATVLVGIVCGLRRDAPLAIGIGLYTLYIAWMGGDFMAGRFFYLPFLGAAILLGRAVARSRAGLLWVGILVIVGMVNPGSPWYNGWRPQQPRSTLVDAHGIADERGWYVDAAALTALHDSMWVLQMERSLDSHAQDTARGIVLFWDYLGYMGYGAGPSVHICDRYALADPLLARLPMHDLPDWRIGHFERVFPRGYHNTLRTGTNQIDDPQLHEYYNRLCRVTRGPLWSVQRWSEIYHFNMGKYDRLIDYGFYRHPSELSVSILDLQQPHPRGEPYMSQGQVAIYGHRPLKISLENMPPFARFEVSLNSEADYIVVFYRNGQLVGEVRLQQQWTGGLGIFQVEVPPSALQSGFDAISVEGVMGSEYYSIGHLIPQHGPTE
jgi:arabinofuranosyltransferase